MDSKLSIVRWFYTIHNCKVSLASFLNRNKGQEIRNAKKKKKHLILLEIPRKISYS